MIFSSLFKSFDWSVVITIVLTSLFLCCCAIFKPPHGSIEEENELLVRDVIRAFTGVRLRQPVKVKDLYNEDVADGVKVTVFIVEIKEKFNEYKVLGDKGDDETVYMAGRGEEPDEYVILIGPRPVEQENGLKEAIKTFTGVELRKSLKIKDVNYQQIADGINAVTFIVEIKEKIDESRVLVERENDEFRYKARRGEGPYEYVITLIPVSALDDSQVQVDA